MPLSWGYTRDNGPATWGQMAVMAAEGRRQSPIDIDPSQARYEQALAARPLRLTYVPRNSRRLVNTGRSALVEIDGSGSSLSGGPLEDTFEVVQFHFHWGSVDSCGSEHRINGETYSAELHIVHYNKSKYSSFAEAASAADGLSVLGVFLKVGRTNLAMQKIIDLLPTISDIDEHVTLNDGFDPASLLPDDTSRYWTYAGSLTTPPCHESITWIVFQDHIEVCEKQLQALRGLRSDEPADDCRQSHIVDNFRPPCALNGRVVQSSFRKFFA